MSVASLNKPSAALADPERPLDASPLEARIREALVRARLITPGDRVVVAVSGGPDSVALLHVLTTLRASLRLHLAVAHVDHQLRPDSASDATFVETLARRWELPCTILTRDVRGALKPGQSSLEEVARRIRYEALLEAARRQGAKRIAVAHTADDQAETVLMRLLRGTGLTGLSAMPLMRPLEETMVIRPLLGCWRQELLGYLKARGASFRQDPTNRDLRFLRNRLRAHLLPLLERDYNPNIKTLLVQVAEQSRVDGGFVHDAAQRHWRRLTKLTHGTLAIRLEPLLRQPEALQRQLIRLAVQHLRGELTHLEFRHWLHIKRLFAERPGTRLDMPGSLQFERTREGLLIRRPEPSPGTDVR